MRRRQARGAAVAAVALAVAAGCGAGEGPRPIRLGEPCAACAMGIHDLRFAAERRAGSTLRVYDAIECLVRDTVGAGGREWLSDYDSRSLHAAESLWVVAGDFPSPMGGGLAAFRDRAAAEAVAARTRGRVGRLAALRAATPGATP